MGWHTNCYVPRTNDPFLVATLKEYEIDEEIGELKDSKEETKFRYARLGDNFMCPFQCDLCHFRNIRGIDPGSDPNKDLKLLIGIRRAILEMFFGRAESAITNNFRDLKKLERIGASLGISNALPNMGPFPLKDVWGMSVAVTMLYRSLDSGIYRDTLQFSSTCKLRSSLGQALIP
jgi:hypothetical protein